MPKVNQRSKKSSQEKQPHTSNIEILSINGNTAKLLLKNVDVSFANALRRIMMVEVV